MAWQVYLSGEIHTDWREQIEAGCRSRKLPVSFTSAVTDHEASDAAGDLLGDQESGFWRDHKSAKVNAISSGAMWPSFALVTSTSNGMRHSTPACVLRWENPISRFMTRTSFIH